MKPQRTDYPTRAEYRWALANWRRAHGGSLIVGSLIVSFLGALTGSSTLLIILLVVWWIVWVLLRVQGHQQQ